MTTKKVGDTLAIEHLPDKRGLRIIDRRTVEAVFAPLSLVRALSAALLDAAADVAGELVGDTNAVKEDDGYATR